MTKRLVAAAALGLTLSTAALAQSYTAPAGIPPSTAPGGLEGRAAPSNLLDTRGRFESRHGAFEGVTTGSLPRRRGDRGGAYAR